MLQSFGGAIETLQAQCQGVARTHISGRDADRTLQQPQRLLEFALLLKPRGKHVEQQRMLEPARERLFGQRSGALEIAILRICQNHAERLHVSL